MPLLRKAFAVNRLDGISLASLVGSRSRAGTDVTVDTAMGLVAVYSATTLIAGAIASLPRRFVQDADTHTEVHPERFRALWQPRANPAHDAMSVNEQRVLSLLLWGNYYGGCSYNGRGDLTEEWPLDPSRVDLKIEPNGTKVFTIAGHGVERVEPGDQRPEVFHIAGPLLPGRVKGMSPIEQNMEHVGLSLAVQRTAAGFYGNGMTMAGAIEYPKGVNREQAREIAAKMRDAYAGPDKAGKWAILDNGGVLKPMMIPPQQAQFIEQQKYGDRKIASMFRVPPHLISDVDASTSWGTGMEELGIAFVVFSLTPWITRIENAIASTFLQGTGLQYRYVLQGLMRGSQAQRYAAYATGRQNGWLSANDVRRLEDMPGIGPDGDVYLSPLNMEPASEADDPAGEDDIAA